MESTTSGSTSIILKTEHIELIPATLEMINTEIEDIEHLSSILNARVEPGWPPGEYDRGAQEYFRERLLEGGAAVIGWYSWYAIQRQDVDQSGVLVGAGFGWFAGRLN